MKGKRLAVLLLGIMGIGIYGYIWFATTSGRSLPFLVVLAFVLLVAVVGVIRFLFLGGRSAELDLPHSQFVKRFFIILVVSVVTGSLISWFAELLGLVSSKWSINLGGAITAIVSVVMFQILLGRHFRKTE